MKYFFALAAVVVVTGSAFAAESVKLITLDPGHFHAALVQKTMHPQVSPVVHVYAPEGPDLTAHMKRIEAYNTRAENPTCWEQPVFTGLDFLERMTRDRAGNESRSPFRAGDRELPALSHGRQAAQVGNGGDAGEVLYHSRGVSVIALTSGIQITGE
jgi:hypothetical protein